MFEPLRLPITRVFLIPNLELDCTIARRFDTTQLAELIVQLVVRVEGQQHPLVDAILLEEPAMNVVPG